MGNNLTLAERIQRAGKDNTGKQPAELDKLEAAIGASLPSGTQQAHITDASVAHDVNAIFSDTEVEAALDALGGKINAILLVLEAYGLTATS